MLGGREWGRLVFTLSLRIVGVVCLIRGIPAEEQAKAHQNYLPEVPIVAYQQILVIKQNR